MKVRLFAFVSFAVLATGIGLVAAHPDSLAARQRDDAARMARFPYHADLDSLGWPRADVPSDPILKLHVDAMSEEGVAWLEANCVKDGHLSDTPCVLSGMEPMTERAKRTEALQATGFGVGALGGIMVVLSFVFWRRERQRTHDMEMAEV